MAGRRHCTDGGAWHHHHPFSAVRALSRVKETAAHHRLSWQRASVRHDRTAGGVFAENVNPFAGSHGIPEAIAIAAIVVLHVWKRNMLLSIAGGTVVYMALLQLVFA